MLAGAAARRTGGVSYLGSAIPSTPGLRMNSFKRAGEPRPVQPDAEPVTPLPPGEAFPRHRGSRAPENENSRRGETEERKVEPAHPHAVVLMEPSRSFSKSSPARARGPAAAEPQRKRSIAGLKMSSAFHEWRSISNGTKLQALGDAASALAVAAIVLTVIDNEYYTKYNEMNNALRSVIAGLCGVIIILMYVAYQMELQALKISNTIPKEETLWSSGLWKMFLVEAFVCSWHVPPGVRWNMEARDTSGSIIVYNEAMLGLTVMGKLYLLARSLRDHHSVCKGGGRFLCTMNATEPSVFFVLKAMLERNPVLVLGSILLCNLVVSSYALVLCERAFEPGYLYSDGLWNLYIALTTVGFGDIYPLTYPGRTVVAISVFFGLCSTALLITVVQETLRLTKPQVRVLETLSTAAFQKELRDAAAACLQRLWRLHKRRRARGGVVAPAGAARAPSRAGLGPLNSAERRALRIAVTDFKLVRKRWREYQENHGAFEEQNGLAMVAARVERVEEMMVELLDRIDERWGATNQRSMRALARAASHGGASRAVSRAASRAAPAAEADATGPASPLQSVRRQPIDIPAASVSPVSSDDVAPYASLQPAEAS
eukprot:tig00000042_g15465.t1